MHREKSASTSDDDTGRPSSPRPYQLDEIFSPSSTSCHQNEKRVRKTRNLLIFFSLRPSRAVENVFMTRFCCHRFSKTLSHTRERQAVFMIHSFLFHHEMLSPVFYGSLCARFRYARDSKLHFKDGDKK